MKPSYNIILSGFMGCGKSTVGRELAKITGLTFVDIDDYIETWSGGTVSQIFDKFGEEYFRDLEHNAARELSRKGGKIIAAGGGTLVFQRNVDVLRATGKIVFINPPLQEIKLRLHNDTTRPLLQRPERDAIIEKLYDARLPVYYKAADIVINQCGTPRQICQNILDALHLSEPAQAENQP